MFKLLKTNKNGIRNGVISLKNGEIKTPLFMPDATRGFVKLLSSEDVKKTKTEVMVINTFHLYLQPGIDVIKAAGGVHNFMGFDGPLLSDSGGFQVFSLIHNNKKMGKITDEKVIFKSPLDGTWHDLSPEKSIQIQFDLGVDMMVCLDDCPPNDFSRPQLEDAVKRTVAWAKRCKAEYKKQIKKRKLVGKNRPLLFAVIQGGAEIDLRRLCAKELQKIGFDGYGFGARPVDRDGNFLEDVLRQSAQFIPEDALRFALGVGTPEDIARCVKLGWDMFDCVIPTREGRHGKLFLKKNDTYETINIRNFKFSRDFNKIQKNSAFADLKNNSFSFLHHLFKSKDALGQKLASINNLEFYQAWLKDIRSLNNK
ncbi:MAG TPA: tRNA guanosine(34) transglycosylase Tgt [Patescibacteria group bacterium]|nr:tRNA guanosine(34) transglycosylase Tgt [Patescibacteria group bacterium]